MGIDYSIDTERATVSLVYDAGGASFDDWQQAIERVLADPRYRRHYGVLTDRRLAPAPPTAEGIRTTIDYVAGKLALRGTRWALLVTGTASYGMMRMGQILGEAKDIEIRVFDSEEAARHWLYRRVPATGGDGGRA